MAKSYTLHDLPQEERPRERLRQVGVDNLSLQELLALIIERGNRRQNVLQLAQNVLSYFGNLKKVKEASLEELKQVNGIGEATACKLKAALKLGEKASGSNTNHGQKISKAEDVYVLLKSDLTNKKREHFKLLSLDTRNQLISIDNISIGTLNSSLAHPREIFKTAIANNAALVILVHNHPSGDPTPSDDDKKLTQRIKQAGEILGIELRDHVVIGSEGFVSLMA